MVDTATVIIVPRVQPGSEVVSTITLSASSYSADENTVASFTVNRADGLGNTVTVDWAITGVAAAAITSGTVTFAPGADVELVDVTLGEVALDQVGTLTLSNAINVTGEVAPVLGSPSSASFTVVDVPVITDVLLSLSSTSYSGNENTNISFYINRTGAVGTTAASVDYAIAGATVSPSSDTVVFSETDTQIRVDVAAGDIAANEFGTLTLSNPQNLSTDGNTVSLVAPSSASFTIQEAAEPGAWQWDVPSLQDERDFYDNVVGWTRTSGMENFESDWITSLGNYSIDTAENLHGQTEGDDLWTWWHQHNRYVNDGHSDASVATAWKDEMLTVYTNQLLTGLAAERVQDQDGFGYDHMYGKGLAAVYNDSGDPGAKTTIDGLRGLLEANSYVQQLVAGTPIAMAYWLARGCARWGITAAYCYEATGETAWGTIRDALRFGFETSTDWEEGNPIQNGGGCFFAGREQHYYDNNNSYTAYDAGRRYQWAPGIGLAAEAMYRLYIQTGSSILRDRLIKMARYVQHYAHDPTWFYPSCGSRFGHLVDGSRYTSSSDGTADNLVSDPSYDISMANVCVIGYKLTNDSTLLNFAHKLLANNRYSPDYNDGPGGPILQYQYLADSRNHVHKFVDTENSPENVLFDWNKGQLQYTYQVFENGGEPTVESAAVTGVYATKAATMSSGTWAEVTGSNFDSFRSSYNSLYGGQGFLEWNGGGYEYKGDIYFTGASDTYGGDSTPTWFLKYTKSTDTWTQLSADTGRGGHTYDGFSVDRTTGNFYQCANYYELLRGDTSGSWVDLSPTGFQGGTIAGSAWFPEANSGQGGLIWFDQYPTTGGLLMISNPSGTAMSTLDTGFGYSGGQQYHNCATYLPKQKVVVFGGGPSNSFFYKVDKNGDTTRLEDTIHEWRPGYDYGTASLVAFENGRIFNIDMNGYDGGGENIAPKMAEYDYDSDQWTDLTAGGMFPSTWKWCCTTALDSIGCILIVGQDASNLEATEWLYKL